MKLKTERDLNYIDPLIADFFRIIAVNKWKDGQTDRQTNGRDFNTSLAEVKNRCSQKQYLSKENVLCSKNKTYNVFILHPFCKLSISHICLLKIIKVRNKTH